MRNTSLRRGVHLGVAALLVLTATLVGACGKDGGITDPGPLDPPNIPSEPSEPGPAGPAPVGERIWAVDLDNNLLLFGAADPTVLSMKRRITGVPILKRILGIGFRPSNGRLYGVGSDSRVYTIDTLTAEATPISQQPFSPAIVDFFDIHFAMALEPSGDRVRLISAESGGNWSISLDDGSATTGERARYAEGTAYAGETPRLLGIVFTEPLPAASLRGGMASLSDPCTDLMYAIDADRAEMIGSCDPDSGLYEPLGKLPEENYARCGELMWGPDGLQQDDVQPPGGLWVLAQRGVEHLNSLGTVNEDGSITWHGNVPSQSPIQSAAFAEGGLYGPRPSPENLRRLERAKAPATVAAAPMPADPRASCPGA
jgi:hypothetical protein